MQDVGKTNFTSDNYGGYGHNSNFSGNNYKSRSSDDFRSSNRDDDEENSEKKKKRKSKSKSKNKDDDEFGMSKMIITFFKKRKKNACVFFLNKSNCLQAIISYVCLLYTYLSQKTKIRRKQKRRKKKERKQRRRGFRGGKRQEEKKKKQKEEDDEETEPNSDNADDDESPKKSQKKKAQKEKKKPFQVSFVFLIIILFTLLYDKNNVCTFFFLSTIGIKGMKLEPLEPPTTDKKTTKSNDFEFDQMTSAFENTNIGGDFDEFAPFDAPQPKASKNQTIQAQSNDPFSFTSSTSATINVFEWDNKPKSNKIKLFCLINWFFKANKQAGGTTGGDLFDTLNSNVSGNGVDDIFGNFQSSETGGVGINLHEEKEVTVKKTLSGAIKEEKTTKKVSEQSKKPTTNPNDAWGLGGNLVNLDNLSKTTTTYAAFNPDSTKKPQSSTGTGIPLTTYGTNRPQFTSLSMLFKFFSNVNVTPNERK
ncbi:hypothetical protein RFI_21214 [Reticulomyxa filosa]|uniref:Uncharacterized protein n=1 Tax=Reticulomyxa filosa TaxID=46433 RepID=X6MRR2_RETFI|nr:hypothetical protein RFI_21214 [Reticulomyxa filosa]|eukprot:ETO16142.1 hypothetical protein RFI_21214 [Reticulomyxa filosa]